ncbi:MAG TPA: hypothetical protein DDZ51_13790 [Planctomycetaceae bacterium]|nr:hypothetical protein [Planctomycetaceae bacterium]
MLDAPVKTFSIGFSEESANELEFARLVSKKYHTEHHEEIVEFDAMEMLPEIVRHHGEPFGDQSAIPTWAVSRLARSEVTMVLSGDGGDELFAGYNSYTAWKRIVDYCQSTHDAHWRQMIRPTLKRLFPSRYPTLEDPMGNPSHWLRCVGRFNKGSRESLWKQELRFLCDLPDSSIELALRDGKHDCDVNRVQRVDLETYLPEDILCKIDIASMRYGLEVRPPMLDRQFFRLASSIDPRSLYRSGTDPVGKLPLKDLLARKLGHEFAYRRKQGFSLPLDAWLRTNKSNQQAVRDRLTAQNAKISEWFSTEAIAETIELGLAENVWLLLALEEWCGQMKPPTRTESVATKCLDQTDFSVVNVHQ